MRHFIRLCCLTLLLLATRTSFAQDCNSCNVDSLFAQVAFKQSDSEKVKLLAQVALLHNGYRIKVKFFTVIDQLIALNNKTKTLDAAPYIAYREAIMLRSQQKYQQALDKLKVAIDGFDKQKKVINPILSLVRILYNSLNQQEERYRFYNEKLNYYLINGPVNNTAACYHGLAGYYMYKGNYDQAISNYLKAAEVYKDISYVNYMNEIADIGVQYSNWGNFDRASYFLNKSLSWARAKKDTGATTFSLMSLANANLKQKAYQKALVYTNEAIKSVAGKRLDRSFAMLILQKAFIYLDQHQTAKTYPLIKQSKSVVDTIAGGNVITNQGGELEIDFALYLYYKEINKKADAQAALLTSYKKAVEANSNELQLKYLRALSQWFINQQKGDDAKLYLEKYYMLNDAVENEQNSTKVAHYENEQKEKQQAEKINDLRQEKAVQAAVINKSRVVTMISLIALLMISGAMIFIYRQSQINKKTLASLRSTQTQLIQSEKMASLGELTAGIAHEIQNPLNFVNNFSEVNTELIDEMQEEINKGDFEEVKAIANDIKENQQKINQHGKRADAIVKGMLEHSRSNSGQKEPADLNAMADEFMRLSYHGLRAKDKSFNAELITHFNPGLPKIEVVQQDIGRVMLNLFNNAFYAVNQKAKTAGANYKPTVEIKTFAPPSGGWGAIVRDNGIGIPGAIKEKIMQPFFTTKPTGEGTGLGLSLSYDIVVKAHGGKLEVDSEEGEYTEFKISIPI